jgi:prepilin-type N-terminal cleavage/methylation domain-containing protein
MAPALLLPIRVTPKTRGAQCPARERSAGFTLIELLVVMAIVAVAMLLGIPAIQNLIVRSRTEGFAGEASVLMQRTRLEAIKMNRGGVVHLDTANRQITAFIDADRDFTFNPDPDEPPRTADYVVGRVPLPLHVEFRDPGGIEGQDSVDAFTPVEVADPDARGAYFQPGGSVADQGAFRICDIRENCFEIRVGPPATGRIELLKWQDGQWLASGTPGDEGFLPWKWN